MRRAYIRMNERLPAVSTLCAILSLTLAVALADSVRADQSECIDPAVPTSVYYMAPSQVDLAQLLMPPPSVDSAAGRADLQAVIEAQRDRTPEQAQTAKADSCVSVFRITDATGRHFSAADLPITAAFFTRVFYDGNRAIGAAKEHFKRPRPFVTDPEIKPIVNQPANASYPSGHATFAYESAILLAIMVPEKAVAIFDRGAEYAHSRVVAGIHFPTDLEAGRISATVIDNALLHNPRFQADLAKSRAEVRKALGLSTQDHAASIPENPQTAQ